MGSPEEVRVGLSSPGGQGAKEPLRSRVGTLQGVLRQTSHWTVDKEAAPWGETAKGSGGALRADVYEITGEPLTDEPLCLPPPFLPVCLFSFAMNFAVSPLPRSLGVYGHSLSPILVHKTQVIGDSSPKVYFSKLLCVSQGDIFLRNLSGPGELPEHGCVTKCISSATGRKNEQT